MSYTGTAWGALVVYGYNSSASVHSLGGSWEVRHKLDATVRNDTGKINSSPVTLMAPIVQLPTGIQYTINIPSTDPDNDFINCRWALSVNGECAGIILISTYLIYCIKNRQISIFIRCLRSSSVC